MITSLEVGVEYIKRQQCVTFLFFAEPEKRIDLFYYLHVGDILYQSKRQHLLLLLPKPVFLTDAHSRLFERKSYFFKKIILILVFLACCSHTPAKAVMYPF